MYAMKIETILIIDNDLRILSGISKLLEREGYKALTTSNSSEGLRMIKEQPVDLIILDGALPELNEIKRLKTRKLIKNVAAIIMRSPTEGEKADLLPSFRSVEYLDKPFKAEELVAVVKKISQSSL